MTDSDWEPNSPVSGASTPSHSSSSPNSKSPTSIVELEDGYGGSEMKEGRVILRVEVSHPEHSHLIGIGGEKVREMRKNCSCLIHYPDGKESGGVSETRGHLQPHSNEVSFRGKLPNAIAGYQAVRDSIFFNLVYDVPDYIRVLESSRHAEIVESQQIFNVEVSLKVDAGYVKQVIIRGPQVQRTLLGAEVVCGFFQDGRLGLPVVSQSLCIHPHSQSAMWNLCDGEKWLNSVSTVTKTTINFPAQRSSDKQTVTIRGSIMGVAAAWIIVMSMLPVTVRVFIHHDTDFKRGDLGSIVTEQLHVNLLVPRRERRPEDRQYVELRSFEGNLENICQAYKHLMQGRHVQLPKQITSASQKLQQLGLDFAIDVASPKLMKKSTVGGTRHPAASSMVPPDLGSLSGLPFPPPFVFPFPGMYPPFWPPAGYLPPFHPALVPPPLDTPAGHKQRIRKPCQQSKQASVWGDIWEKREEEQKRRYLKGESACECCRKPSAARENVRQREDPIGPETIRQAFALIQSGGGSRSFERSTPSQSGDFFSPTDVLERLAHRADRYSNASQSHRSMDYDFSDDFNNDVAEEYGDFEQDCYNHFGGSESFNF